ncbi:PQQ-binding-like beta-propeller repeat protein [Erythrobacter sp. THAF29]|uniref:outer membrane protein assembly factor BamB family protein n=1 Tax=Erythrobacter sp. THAF29 TaxID=2587851 RepID=UPI0012683FA6|nr:PQQ-binding-like beta-propeller repeat protein [Erythrobacter sp. THAF29]QFT76931.1 Quinoprotein glucose dehydrogenase [Erythrobacter sp. THAF29]
MRTIVHWAFVVLLFLIGLLLTVPGGFLIYLGGSPYYLIAGAMTLTVAWFTSRRSPRAVQAFAAILIGTVVWSLYEAGFDLFALLPRLAAWMVLGTYFLTPWYRTSLKPQEAEQAPTPNRWLIGGPIVAGLVLIGVSALQGYERNGTGTVRGTISAAAGGDWVHYGNDVGGSRFATLDQINPETISGLQEVWRYRTGVEEDFKATPLAIDGRLFLCAAANVVIALDGATGEELWRFDPELEPLAEHQYAITCRGVAYHRAPPEYAGPCPRRIVTATINASLIALDAETGELCEGFGAGGMVDLREGMGEHLPGDYYHTSPPTVAGGKLVVGGLVNDRQDLGLPSGVVRAFDAITGELAWAWDLGNPDNRGLPAEGERYTPGTPNVWSIMSYDPELDLVFAPTGNANPDYFGGVRRDFDDRYSSAVVAIDASTGEERWTFQTVRHDIWDYDVPAQPVLVDVERGGERVPSIVIPTKMGELFLLDRRDGKPVYPIQDRPVAQDPELGEYLSDTQPFSPLPNFHPYRFEKDMWGLTPIDQMVCRIEYRMMRYEGMYTPPTRAGTLIAPGNFGGFNWGSVSVDADNGLLIAAPMLLAHRLLLVTPEQVAEAGPQAALLLGEEHPAVRMTPDAQAPRTDPDDPYNYNQIAYYGLPMPFMSRLGTAIPCFEPPWSRIAVIDLNTKELLWRRPAGDMRNSGPFGLRSGLPIDVGTAVRAGTMTTRGGLTFLSSTMDSSVRAFDVRTGEEKWASDLPGNGQSTPMTFTDRNGRQFLVVTVPNPSWIYPRDPSTGKYLDSATQRDGQGGYVIAYALPQTGIEE